MELFVVTVEEESLFQAAYPAVVALYLTEKSEVLKKKQKSKSKSLSLLNLWMGLARIQETKATNIPPTAEQYHVLSRSGRDILQGLCLYCTVLYFSTRESELCLISYFDMPFLFFYRQERQTERKGIIKCL